MFKQFKRVFKKLFGNPKRELIELEDKPDRKTIHILTPEAKELLLWIHAQGGVVSMEEIEAFMESKKSKEQDDSKTIETE